MARADHQHLAAFDAAFMAASSRRRIARAVGFTIFLVLFALAAWVADFSLTKFIEGAPRIGSFFSELVPPIRTDALGEDIASWYWGIGEWLRLLWTTLMIALFGTAAGTIAGLFLGLFANRRYGTGRRAAWLARRVLEFARTVPDLVWALIFVFAFGLGPLAGALAIFVHSAGAQGKLFADVNENAEPGPLEGVRASGGSWLDEMFIGLIPQVLPNYVSYSLWRLELNVRSATVIGFVGAGGIGMALYEALSLTYYDDAGAILLLVFCTVVTIDSGGEWLRLKLVDHRSGT